MNTLDQAIGRLRAAVERAKRTHFANVVLNRDDAAIILAALDMAPPQDDGLPLTLTERLIYTALAQHVGDAVHKRDLRRVRKGGRELSKGSLEVHMRRLRVKLAEANRGEIQTVRNVGYQLKPSEVSNG